jgi:riboflavin kinase/FMN adenylyltransferase
VRLKRNRPGSPGSKAFCRSVVTLGNFDGVHQGHQALVNRCVHSRRQGELAVGVSFEPLPQAFFRPDHAPARLSTVYQKLAMLRSLGLDLCWLLRFDLALSQLPAADFVQRVLVDSLAVRHVVVGQDYRFGHRRLGDLGMLESLGREAGFTVETVEPVLAGSERISSTAIRQALAEGDLAKARLMLGRPYQMEGHVVRGQQLGRTLGYATANLRVRALPSPLQGIFATRARLCRSGQAGEWLPGVASLGRRPTVNGRELLLEVHLFDYSGDLYGQRLQVEFVAKLRDELRFDDLPAMQKQMRLDDEQARQVLANMECPQRG